MADTGREGARDAGAGREAAREAAREPAPRSAWAKQLPDILHFSLAMVLVIGILVTYAVSGQVPEVLAFSLTSVIGYYFGRSNNARAGS